MDPRTLCLKGCPGDPIAQSHWGVPEVPKTSPESYLSHIWKKRKDVKREAQNKHCSKKSYLCPRPWGSEKERPTHHPSEASSLLQTPFPPPPRCPYSTSLGFLCGKPAFLQRAPTHPKTPREPLLERLKGLNAFELSDLGFCLLT